MHAPWRRRRLPRAAARIASPLAGQGFAAVEASFETYHVDVFGRVVPTAPLGCAGLGQTWLPALPPTWSGSRQLVMFDGSGHGATVPIGTQLLATAALYLAAKMP